MHKLLACLLSVTFMCNKKPVHRKNRLLTEITTNSRFFWKFLCFVVFFLVSFVPFFSLVHICIYPLFYRLFSVLAFFKLVFFSSLGFFSISIGIGRQRKVLVPTKGQRCKSYERKERIFFQVLLFFIAAHLVFCEWKILFKLYCQQ